MAVRSHMAVCVVRRSCLLGSALVMWHGEAMAVDEGDRAEQERHSAQLTEQVTTGHHLARGHNVAWAV